MIRELEELGYASVWFGEAPGGRDPFTRAATLLEATDRIGGRVYSRTLGQTRVEMGAEEHYTATGSNPVWPAIRGQYGTSIYVDGAQCAFNYMQDIFYTSGKGFYPFYGDDNQWGAFAIPIEQAPLGFPMEEDGVPLINARATFYFYGTYLPANLGPSSFYIMANRDANGEILNGTDTYRLTIASDAPAKDFWSIIAYSALTKGFIRDADRVGISSREKDALKVNDDGSVDVYFAPAAPKSWESNWIPTGEDWLGMFRLYGPEEAAFDKSFVLPNIEKIE